MEKPAQHGISSAVLDAEFDAHAVDWVVNRTLASEVFYKEMFLDSKHLAGAHWGRNLTAVADVAGVKGKSDGQL